LLSGLYAVEEVVVHRLIFTTDACRFFP